MDAISYSYADKQAKRIKKFIENPDSNSGIVTVPKVIGAEENITIPAGRVAVLPNVQIDGTLNVEGEVFIPAGTTLDKVVEVTGNQNIDGIKTFYKSPIVPTPTSGTQVANKSYVDGLNSTNVKQSANLSDLTNAGTARTNLGLGTAATKDVGTSQENVMQVGAFGLVANGLTEIPVKGTNDDVWNSWNNVISGWGSGSRTGSPTSLKGTIGKIVNIGLENWGTQLFFDYYGNQVFFRGKESPNTIPNPWREFRHTGNTTVDSNGFIKSASPIVSLYRDRAESNGSSELEEIQFERITTGHYRLTGVPELSRDGWYIETPKDRNGNVYFTLDYVESENTLEILTYTPDYSSGRATNGAPVDIIDGRFVSLRFAASPETIQPEEA